MIDSSLSYDESVVLWDTRAMGSPLKDVGTGGGVWRVKWHWREPDLVAAACMHNGCHIVNCHLNSGTACYGRLIRARHACTSKVFPLTQRSSLVLRLCVLPTVAEPMAVVHSYTEHQSLAYGVDWCRAETGRGGSQREDSCQSSSELTSALLASCSFYDHSLHVWTADKLT